MTKEKILIVEDDGDIRELTSLYLNNKGYEVLTSGDGYDALNKLNNENPQLVILDILLPGMQGYEICEKIRLNSDVPILFLSCKRDSADKVKGLEVGADDYITKPFDLAELEARVKANLRRNKLQSFSSNNNRIAVFGHLEIDFNSYDVYVEGKKIALFKKELKLLLLLVENPNQVFSAEQLYDQIWGIDSLGDLKTVMVHVSNLRRKIEKDPTKPKLIQTVRGFGYKFSPPGGTDN
ncbi:response regulator transcription factor [Evansella sp. AB-P1]|uniref:response regulator transcription factor n=1 Tax=Evansella sp. AB-P1 TaxID=3037653 RepID=UPI00241BEEC0|nr:response regulator transcription factor [Evansella sp. AB-P1]MDG5786030.1 response regulator transcription factor [Evansella sp. AB-P1]